MSPGDRLRNESRDPWLLALTLLAAAMQVWSLRTPMKEGAQRIEQLEEALHRREVQLDGAIGRIGELSGSELDPAFDSQGSEPEEALDSKGSIKSDQG